MVSSVRSGVLNRTHSLLVAQCNFNIVELGILEFLTYVVKRMLQLISQMLWVGPAIRWGAGCHFVVQVKLDEGIFKIMGILNLGAYV